MLFLLFFPHPSTVTKLTNLPFKFSHLLRQVTTMKRQGRNDHPLGNLNREGHNECHTNKERCSVTDFQRIGCSSQYLPKDRQDEDTAANQQEQQRVPFTQLPPTNQLQNSYHQ